MKFTNKTDIFFDLDHTLWDFEQNSKEALHEIFIDFKLEKLLHCSFTEFINVYHQINHAYWDDYKKGKVTREKLRNGRFHDTLSFFQISNNTLGIALSESYISRSPYKTQLFEGAIRVLDYLKHKNYALHIITNGFKEVQHIKLDYSNLKPFFEHIIISEEHGFNKPDIKIFDLAQQLTNAQSHQCVMIGDNYDTDILGALNANWKAIYLSNSQMVNASDNYFQINRLINLKELF